jgi:DNA processing protein
MSGRIRTCVPGDPGFPPRLAGSGVDRLFVVGGIPDRCVTVVGARAADLAGIEAARRLGRDLAAAGFGVATGGAAGIDRAALEGALETGGTGVAVLPCGILRPYPAANADLFLRAAETGALLGPFPPEVEARPAQFHLRNRILAALGEATVLVRAGLRSGALSTVRRARQLGRPVLVVPGATVSPSADGSNRLIRDGWPVALGAADVLDAVAAPTERPATRPRGTDTRTAATDDPLVSLLQGGEAATADDLIRALGAEPLGLVARLGALEAAGRVRRLPDGRYRAA